MAISADITLTMPARVRYSITLSHKKQTMGSEYVDFSSQNTFELLHREAPRIENVVCKTIPADVAMFNVEKPVVSIRYMTSQCCST